MPVYFIASSNSSQSDLLDVKIGLSANVLRRKKELQTGNPNELKLMGYIKTEDDATTEKALHHKHSSIKRRGEWFQLTSWQVHQELKSHGIQGYIALQENTFEIIGYDRKGIPERAGPWEWDDVDYQDFCPTCGCSCGLHYEESVLAYSCLRCGIFYPESLDR